MGSVEMRRHGDVLILSQEDFIIPKGTKLTAGKLLHKGSNNSHVLSKGTASFGILNGKKVMRVKTDSIVSHIGGSATHASKPLPKGDYWIEIQSYYDHMAEEAKQVVD